MQKRHIAIIAAVSAAAVLIVIICVLFFRREETYRSVRVLGYKGQVDVTRNGENFPIYKNLTVRGGDAMITGENSEADLQLDDDKYLLVEPKTRLSFELEGNREKGAIRIHLQEGAIFNTIENPLSDGDSYEVVTPDGVMAVRGTRFRVAVGKAADGSMRVTRVIVLDGVVYIELDNAAKDHTSLAAGQEAIIDGDYDEDGNCRFRVKGQKIDIDEVPEYLKEEVRQILAGPGAGTSDSATAVTGSAASEYETSGDAASDSATAVTDSTVSEGETSENEAQPVRASGGSSAGPRSPGVASSGNADSAIETPDEKVTEKSVDSEEKAIDSGQEITDSEGKTSDSGQETTDTEKESEEEKFYQVTVESYRASGKQYTMFRDSVAAGKTVTLTAPGEEGRSFDHWEIDLSGDGSKTMSDSTTSFKMPEHDVRIVLVYRE